MVSINQHNNNNGLQYSDENNTTGSTTGGEVDSNHNQNHQNDRNRFASLVVGGDNNLGEHENNQHRHYDNNNHISSNDIDTDNYNDDDNDDDHHSNNNSNNHNVDDDDDEVEEQIAHRETRHVTYLRLGLLLTLFLATSIVSTCVYLFVRDGEQDELERCFVAYSTKLTEAFQSIAERRLGAIAAFSTTITSFAIATNSSWPFVTVPNYEAQVRHIGKLANVESMSYAPIVSVQDRDEWENNYVPQQIPKWQAESIYTNQFYDDPPVSTNNITGPSASSPIPPPEPYYEGQPDYSANGDALQIIRWSLTGRKSFIVTGDGPFMPWFQTAPFQRYGANNGIINLDLNTDPTFDNNTLIDILSRGKAALGKIARAGYGSPDPASGFYYPILEGIANNSTVVGSLGTLIFWLPYFANILPTNAIGFIGVLQNTCQQAFTFRMDGSNVTYVGDGDQHDPKYDYLQHEASFLDLINKSIQSQEYLGLPLDEDGCQYVLRIYASADMEAEYISSKPLIYMLVAMMIFLVTSLLFLIYDRLVERRQRLVLHQAESSGAIVSSLFPAAYRERLMAAQRKQIIQQKKLGTMKQGSKESTLQSFLNGENIDMDGDNDEPIADNFLACTVMFGDIAGFTKWSASREPVQVFCLLQEVYREFDLIAKRLRVFKVETIGDCYMAVAGLPNPQPHHARLMARFANDCLLQIRQTTSRLSSKLGEGTSDLTLRIGLHSGPVTAGILRGDKSRFQLFGDTVNTASRMESTGEKNRIQVSELTAELLIQAGKGHWLIPRDDMVEAKGKGMLKTFWLVDELGRSSTSNLPPSQPFTSSTSSNNNDSNNNDTSIDATDNVDYQANDTSTRRDSFGALISI